MVALGLPSLTKIINLPFDLRPEVPSYDTIAAVAYRAPLNAEGVAVLPAEWDDGDE